MLTEFLLLLLLLISPFLVAKELALNANGEMEEVVREAGKNNVGMVAWKLTLFTPEYPKVLDSSVGFRLIHSHSHSHPHSLFSSLLLLRYVDYLRAAK